MPYRFIIFMSTQLKILKYNFNNPELGHFSKCIKIPIFMNRDETPRDMSLMRQKNRYLGEE